MTGLIAIEGPTILTCEVLVIGTIFLAITAISALLVASPRRVLVMLPLLAAVAGSGGLWLWAQSLKVGRAPSQERSL